MSETSLMAALYTVHFIFHIYAHGKSYFGPAPALNWLALQGESEDLEERTLLLKRMD